jgi:hypothetical protein
MDRRILTILTGLSAVALLVLAEPSPGQTPSTRVKKPKDTVYRITMTTTFVVPAGNDRIDQVRVYHALPTLQPWSQSKAKYGATNLGFRPSTAKLKHHAPTDSYYLLWTVNERQKPGKKLTFTTTMTVTSRDRDITPAAGKVTWDQYATPPADRTAVVDPAIAKEVHPDLAKVAARFKAKLPPSRAVPAMCKWIADNIKYDASVTFPSEADPNLGARAYSLPACQIQNNRWFQNYTIWMRESGMEKQPTWTTVKGGFRSDYGVEHIISYTRTK